MSTILVSGASGFIGSHLTAALASDGHRVITLSRSAAALDSVHWNPEAGEVDRDSLARAEPDAVVNLAGEPIAQRWTATRKRRIRDSRVRGTAALSEALAALTTKPKVLVSGSAIGYYGAHRDDELLDEGSAAGSDFLAETARDWEAAARPASDAGIRLVLARTGLVLGAAGGVLKSMLPPFRLGLGGRLGSGRQWMSWISMADMVRALRLCLDNDAVQGPVNCVAPHPERNADFTRTLARVLRRPAPFPVPTFVLEMMFGTMADSTILASQRVAPKRLAGAGFEFRHPRLEAALRAELTRSVDPGGR